MERTTRSRKKVDYSDDPRKLNDIIYPTDKTATYEAIKAPHSKVPSNGDSRVYHKSIKASKETSNVPQQKAGDLKNVTVSEIQHVSSGLAGFASLPLVPPSPLKHKNLVEVKQPNVSRSIKKISKITSKQSNPEKKNDSEEQEKSNKFQKNKEQKERRKKTVLEKKYSDDFMSSNEELERPESEQDEMILEINDFQDTTDSHKQNDMTRNKEQEIFPNKKNSENLVESPGKNRKVTLKKLKKVNSHIKCTEKQKHSSIDFTKSSKSNKDLLECNESSEDDFLQQKRPLKKVKRAIMQAQDEYDESNDNSLENIEALEAKKADSKFEKHDVFSQNQASFLEALSNILSSLDKVTATESTDIGVGPSTTDKTEKPATSEEYWKNCYERLSLLRETQAETQLESLRKHTAERAEAQVALIAHLSGKVESQRNEIDHLRQEKATITERTRQDMQILEEKVSKTKEHAMATMNEAAELKIKVTNLEAKVNRQRKLLLVYQQLTGLAITLDEENNSQSKAICTAVDHVHRRAVQFNLKFPPEEGNGDVQYKPIANAMLLPDFMQDTLSFPANQSPMFLSKLLEGLFRN